MKTNFTFAMACLCLSLTLCCQTFATTTFSAMPESQDTVNCDLAVTLTATNSCATGGHLAVTRSGGTAPFLYLWQDGATTENMVNPVNGNYSLTVTDVNGCTSSDAAVIDVSGGIIIDAYITQANCGSANGAVAIWLYDGTEPYTFAWSNGETDSHITAIPAGEYSVSVTDAAGCSLSETYMVPGTVYMHVATDVTPDSCGLGHGAAYVNAVSGVAPYEYSWSTGHNAQFVDSLLPGTYTVTVTDAVGCVVPASVTISGAPLATTVAEVTACDCEDHNGAVTLLAAGGTPPYAYQWESGEAVSQRSQLGVGDYHVTITDAIGCQRVKTISVPTNGYKPQISDSVATPICAMNDGGIYLNITGGTEPFEHMWSNEATAQNLEGVGEGTYMVTVTGADGCWSCDTITVVCAAEMLSADPGVIETALSLFPNPATDKVTLQTAALDGPAELTIYNSFGQLVYLKSDVTSVPVTLDVAMLSNGIYNVSLKSNYQRFSAKLVRE